MILEIKNNIEQILENNFYNKRQHNVVKYEDRLNFACPYCGDSSDLRKRRGNLYLSNLSYHCFNCGKHTNYLNFLNDFDVPLNSENIDEIVSHIKKSNSPKSSNILDIKIFNIIDDISLTRDSIKRTFSLKEIEKNSKIYEYLSKRCLLKKLNNFLYDDVRDELWLLNLSKCGKISGAQIRSFNDDKVKYRTYNISKLYKYSKKDLPITDDKEISLINQFSITYNIMNVNLLNDVYVFEGYIDAMFLKNSIGICGVNRSFEFIDNLPNTKFLFDNDKAGFLVTKNKLHLNKYVFMWNKFLNDLDIKIKIKDFNELIIYMVDNKIKFDFNKINNYFTNNELDLINV